MQSLSKVNLSTMLDVSDTYDDMVLYRHMVPTLVRFFHCGSYSFLLYQSCVSVFIFFIAQKYLNEVTILEV